MDKQDTRFWFSWLNDSPSTPTSTGEQVLQQAIDKVIGRLCIMEETREAILPFLPSSKAYSLPEALEPLLDHMNGKELSMCYVWGTLDPVSAKSVSIRQLGIDIFSLPDQLPTDGSKTESCFKYVDVSSLTSVLKGYRSSLERRSIEDIDRNRIRLQLKAARCNTWLERCRSRVAHGNRDIVQFENTDNVQSALQDAFDACPSPQYLVCEGDCTARIILHAGIEKLSTDEFGITKNEIAKDLANLDCLTPKLASLLLVPREVMPDHPVFDQIVIFEDNQDMRNHLVDSLREQFSQDCEIIVADPIKSMETRTLVAEDGELIGGFSDSCHKLGETHQKQLRTLLCFDLEVRDRSGERLDIRGIPPGLWFLYKCSKDYPLASRLVITGHRRLDEQGMNAGASDLLFKPFTDVELSDAIRSASKHRVLWVSPESVREEWCASFRPICDGLALDDHDPLESLGAWLSGYNLQMEVIHDCSLTTEPGDYDLVVLDLHQLRSWTDDYKPNRLTANIASIRQWPRQPKLIVLLPYERSAMRSDGILKALGYLLRDGEDKILHKPIALADKDNVESVGLQIIKSLADTPDFDVKYAAIAPLMGLVWARSQTLFLKAIEQEGCNENDPVLTWAPLAVLMGDCFGFSSAPKAVVNKAGHRKVLIGRLKEEIKNNAQRWEEHRVNAAEVVANFCADCEKSESLIQTLPSIETWLRKVIDLSPDTPGAKESFEDDLVSLFGGKTRLSFGSAGGWFSGTGEYVSDMSLIIEFCAKKGILARAAIEKVVVGHLTEQGLEEMVLIQEIPVRGYMLPR